MKKAIDVVLLPSPEIIDLAIALNAPWIVGSADEIVLNEKNCVPHITLAMGVIDDHQMADINLGLRKIANKFSPLLLKIVMVESRERADGRVMSGLVIDKSAELQELHEVVMDELAPMFTYDDVAESMFYSPPKVNHVPSYWVKGYAKNSVREKYRPHITLGMGVPESLDLPITFTAKTLALFHLGAYCTCRDLLGKVELSG